MKFMNHATLALCVLSGASLAAAESPKTQKKHAHESTRRQTRPGVSAQIEQMRQEMQAQMDAMKQQLAQRDAELSSVKQALKTLEQQSAISGAQSEAANAGLVQNTTDVMHLQTAVQDLKTTQAVNTAGVQQVEATVAATKREVDAPASLRFKGVTITPGGFIAAEGLWRQRALNADIYTNWNGTPYPGAGEAHTSEFVPSARQTRPSVLISGKSPVGTLRAFFEGDFLSAGTTSNNLQSNSYTLRVRQAWAQVVSHKTTVTGGEMWTLLTEDKKAAEPGQENLPLFFDGNLHVGFTYVRQPGFRVQQAFSSKFALAAAVENSQYQFSASNAPSNFFFGAPGAAGGLNNSAANYTNQVAPDVIVKASFDPGYGHYEVGGVLRFFRDRYYPSLDSAAGAQNDTEIGGGFSASARFPVMRKVQLGAHLVAGDGTGRYGASILPDITVKPNGTLEPLRNAQGIASIEVHPTKRYDLFAYAGTEYVQRTYYRNDAGVLVGYAPPSANNAGCEIEAVPTAGTGYAPGIGTCLGATRDLVQGSAGWLYRLYDGPQGRLQYGVAYSYLVRRGWAGQGGAPEATNNFVYTSMRYYLP